MKIKNLGNLINDLKPLLKRYLEDMGTSFNKTHFTCPNKKEHLNNDNTPACNFYPDEEHFKCFVCSATGDIFNAVHLLEDRPLEGQGFITDNILYLAKKYNISYELEEETQEEKEYNLVSKFLTLIIELANKNLLTNSFKEVNDYLVGRNWNELKEVFKLGYLELNNSKIKEYFELFSSKYPNILEKYIDLNQISLMNRLIYPLYNTYGGLVGISTRSLEKKPDYSKYRHHILKLNDKPINLLFNSNNLKKFNKVYLVEGASSVFTLTKNNITNVVALLGCSFSTSHFETLIKMGIKDIVLCLDGDFAGNTGINKAILFLQNKPELNVFIKKLEDNLDPDDIINKYGIDHFNNIPEISLFKYQVIKYLKTEDHKERDSLFEIILSQKEALKQDKMIQFLAKEADIKKTILLEDLKNYELKNKLFGGVSTVDYIEEAYILEREIEEFESYRWKIGGLIGLDFGYPLLNNLFDGLRTGLHLIGGKWNVGKSIFCMNIALNLLKNEQNYILYFSIDDPNKFQTIPRMIGCLSKLDTDTILKPRSNILNNDSYSDETKDTMLKNIEEASTFLRTNSHRFTLKDAKYNITLQGIIDNIKLCKKRALDLNNKNLIVVIDFLHMIEYKNNDELQKLITISTELKKASTLYEIPIVCTVTGTKAGFLEKNLRDEQIKGPVELQFKADSIFLLESDFYEDHGKMFFHDEIDGTQRPLISVNITKNKLGGRKGKLFYKFYNNFLRFEELTEENQILCKKGFFNRVT